MKTDHNRNEGGSYAFQGKIKFQLNSKLGCLNRIMINGINCKKNGVVVYITYSNYRIYWGQGNGKSFTNVEM